MTSTSANELSRLLEPLMRGSAECSRPALCYPCALRMSTMFNVRPPPTRSVVVSHLAAETARGGSTRRCERKAWQAGERLPLVCSSANEIFDIVYETVASARRVWQPDEGRTPSVSFENPFHVNASTSTPFVCVACCGLYQFLDDVTAPLLAASVRVSPYLDSVEITTNVNCPRAMTFVWLAAAALFRAGSREQTSNADAAGRQEATDEELRALTTGCTTTSGELGVVGSSSLSSSATGGSTSVSEAARRLPRAEDIIPEEYTNFKDFFMADIRARALRYLARPLPGPLSGSAEPTAGGADTAVASPDLFTEVLSAVQEHRRLEAQRCPSYSTSEEVLVTARNARGSCSGEYEEGGDEPTRAKRPRTETTLHDSSSANAQVDDKAIFSETRIPRLCSQALRYAPLDGGVILDVDVLCPSCYEDVAIPEKHLLGNAAAAASNQKTVGPQQQRGALRHLSSVIPPVYCSNKSGAVMAYRVLYDYMFPFLLDHGLGAYRNVPSATAGGGGPTADATTTEAAASRTESGNAATSSGGGGGDRGIVAGVRSSVSHGNVYLIGRYRKLLRSLSQSPWFHEGGRIGSFSLQEIIADPFLTAAFPYGVPRGLLPSNVARRQARAEEYLSTLGDAARAELDQSTQRKCRNRLPGGQASPWQEVDPFQVALQEVRGYGWYKFHSAGREDVDVRMLGSGRPFVLELIAPHRQRFTADELRVLEAEVNASHEGSIEITGVTYTQAEITQILARHSESKTKTYRCVVWSSRALPADDALLTALPAVRDLSISQRTPLRVLHRRSLLERHRIIHTLSYQRVNDHWLVVDLETQAGTYVKEFIHGDCGRTTPNLGILLQSRTDIVQLDVLGMVMADDIDAPR